MQQKEIKENNEYLVLLLTAKQYKIFHGIDNMLEKVKIHMPDHSAAFHNTVSTKTANFTNSQDRKEVMLDKFVHHADEGLDMALQQYHLPVFLLATERVAGHFMKTSHHANVIKAYIHGNYEAASVSELLDVLSPQIVELHMGYERALANRISRAINAGKFVYGLENVKRNAKMQKGSILIVERDHLFPNDRLESIIQDVAASAGTIVYTNRELMNRYDHIGLIQYY